MEDGKVKDVRFEACSLFADMWMLRMKENPEIEIKDILLSGMFTIWDFRQGQFENVKRLIFEFANNLANDEAGRQSIKKLLAFMSEVFVNSMPEKDIPQQRDGKLFC